MDTDQYALRTRVCQGRRNIRPPRAGSTNPHGMSGITSLAAENPGSSGPFVVPGSSACGLPSRVWCSLLAHGRGRRPTARSGGASAGRGPGHREHAKERAGPPPWGLCPASSLHPAIALVQARHCRGVQRMDRGVAERLRSPPPGAHRSGDQGAGRTIGLAAAKPSVRERACASTIAAALARL